GGGPAAARCERLRARGGPRVDPGGNQGGQRSAGGPPARRRVPDLARGRPAADAHVQGQARRRPALGRVRRAAAGPRGGGTEAAIPRLATERLLPPARGGAGRGRGFPPWGGSGCPPARGGRRISSRSPA